MLKVELNLGPPKHRLTKQLLYLLCYGSLRNSELSIVHLLNGSVIGMFVIQIPTVLPTTINCIKSVDLGKARNTIFKKVLACNILATMLNKANKMSFSWNGLQQTWDPVNEGHMSQTVFTSYSFLKL